MPIKIMIDPNKVGARVMGVFEEVLPEVSEEILADCNEYCKEDQNTLIMSSLEHKEDLKRGRLIWDTPYAKRQYWEIRTAHKQPNPQASWRWCEVAKRKHKEGWANLAERRMKEKL